MKRKILLVDDVPVNIEFIINILKDEYSLLAATNGEKALQLAQNNEHIDLILLDIVMPGMDGYEVCKRLKANDLTRSIPVIFITSKNESDDETKGLKLGAVDYITKPINPAILKARVFNHIELKQYQSYLEEMVSERTQQLEQAEEAIIESMGIVAEHRDPETGAHIFRTKEYVKIIAQALATQKKYSEFLTPKRIKNITIAAPLHDLGKIAISDEILLKPSTLGDEEWEVMKTHTTIGDRTIDFAKYRYKENEILYLAKEIALSHHERYDGSGYPHGLKEKEIPLAARIMAVADVYDAIISERPYKKPMTHKEALDYIYSQKGQHFDPDIVDAFLAISDEIKKTALEFYENGNST